MASALRGRTACRLALVVGSSVLCGAGCSGGAPYVTNVHGTSTYSARQLVSSGPRGLGPVGAPNEWTLAGELQGAVVGANPDNGAALYTSTVTASALYALFDWLEMGVAARIPLPGTQRANKEPRPAVRGTPRTEVGISARAMTKKLGPVRGIFGLHVAGSDAVFARESEAIGVETHEDCRYEDTSDSDSGWGWGWGSGDYTCTKSQGPTYRMNETNGGRRATVQYGAQFSVLIEALPQVYVELGSVLQKVPAWDSKYAFSGDCKDMGDACLRDVANSLPDGHEKETQILPFLALTWRTGLISVIGHVYTTAVSERIVLPIAGGVGFRLHL